MHHFIAAVLATSSLALAHHSITATRHFSRPVQPTAFADDPALLPPRPLVILTPSESDLGDVESTLSSSPTVEATTIPFEDVDPTLFILSTSSILHSSPSSTSLASSTAAFASSTSTAPANHAEKRLASSSSPSLTTITGTSTTTSSTSNPASVPTAFANAAVGLIAIVGLAMAL